VVQRGDSLTVQADLVNVADGSQIWGERYNRKASDILAVQEDIVRAIVGTLRPRLSGEQQERVNKRFTENAEAYQLYLKGLFYQNKRTMQGVQKAIEYFQQAIALDQNYALAYAGLADAYGLLASYGDVSPRITMPKAREAALKAISLDNDLAEAHTALGYSLQNYDVAEREYKRAIELNPNYATAHHYYANLLSKSGRHEEALAESRRALEIEPLSLVINRAYGDRLFFARRYDDAIAQLKKTLELDAAFPSAHYTLALAYQMRADHAEAVEEHAQYQELIGERQKAALIRESYARGGWQGFLRTITDERLRFNLSWDDLTAYYAALGEKDKAFANLNKAYENGARLVNLKVDPRLDSLRDDPRFADLIRKGGLPQ
jgi:tetratricopeptide (TPR) repeat protein